MASKQSQLEKHKPTGNLPESGIDRNYDGHGRDQDQIRKDMARTRAGIDHTLDDLERKVQPRTLVSRMVDTLRDDVARSETVRTVRRNPGPVAMMAAGAAWMAVKQYRSKKAMREPQTLEPADVPEPMGVAETRATVEPSSLGYPLETDLQGRDIAPPASGHETGMPLVQAQPQERTTGEKVKQAASGAAQKTKEAASQASGKVRDVAGAARERVGQAYERTKEVASQAAHTVRDKAAQAKDAAADAYEEHPLAFAAAAVAAGVLLGQLVPSTRREDEMMGESRDKLVQGAKAKGREIGERAKATGEAALDAARDEADKQGAGPSGLREKIHQAGESIKEIGRRAKDAARQESEQQGLTPQQLSDEARDVARRGGQQAPKESDEDKPLGDRGPM